MDAQQQTKLGEILSKIGHFFSKIFRTVKQDIAPIAVAVTQAIKHASEIGLLPDVASLIDKLTNSHIATDIATYVANNVNKFLAAELGLLAIPDDSNAQQFEDWASSVAEAIAGLSAKKKTEIWTRLAVFVQDDIKQKSGEDNNFTFAESVQVLEDSYQEYKKLEADENTNNG